ncbi:hypothetical protein IWW36_005493 [Coemansia brasiliensis]|uniref:AA9 family lytic polysaccharide monooxygenase n=1 Tax=Coemansia brasiliensis TaxID=2650707 RepID=A0A9W8LXS8_9FUNG|nr:hypothetical protein IWW36_005493 [Coemansia brasiliensis]
MFAVPIWAHTYMTNVSIEGEKLEEGKCIVPPWSNENFPEKDVTSKNMLCRSESPQLNGGTFCDVNAGSKFVMHFHESGPTDRAISDSHKGPCLAYMAKAESNGDGNVWFKIYEDGYDASSDTWCVDTLIKNDGALEVTIPADISPGKYLLRGEIIALHEADRVYGEDKDAGAEFFPSCAMINVVGTGTANPGQYAIPGIYDKNDPGIFFNLWDGDTNYIIPGPAIYTPGTAPAGSVNTTKVGTGPVVSSPVVAPSLPVNSNSGGKSKACLSKRHKKCSSSSSSRKKKRSRSKKHQRT